jgi:hypothetical protein
VSTTFPSTLVLRYPVTQTLTAPVDVAEFLDGTEQRCRTGEFLQSFELSFPDVPITELASLRTFWATVKGAFDSGWTFAFQGTNYANMALEADDLTEVESGRPEKVTVGVKMRQTLTAGGYAGTPPAAFPSLYGAVVAQRPFTTRPQFRTTRNDLANGARFAWAEWGTPKAAWTIEYSCLTASELASRLSCFVALGGRYRGFAFTDPNTGVTHAHCRLDADALAMRWVGAGQCSVTVSIAEYFA